MPSLNSLKYYIHLWFVIFESSRDLDARSHEGSAGPRSKVVQSAAWSIIPFRARGDIAIVDVSRISGTGTASRHYSNTDPNLDRRDKTPVTEHPALRSGQILVTF